MHVVYMFVMHVAWSSEGQFCLFENIYVTRLYFSSFC